MPQAGSVTSVIAARGDFRVARKILSFLAFVSRYENLKRKRLRAPARELERVRRFLVRTCLKSVRDWAAILRQAGSKLTGLLRQQGPGRKITVTASHRL